MVFLLGFFLGIVACCAMLMLQDYSCQEYKDEAEEKKSPESGDPSINADVMGGFARFPTKRRTDDERKGEKDNTDDGVKKEKETERQVKQAPVAVRRSQRKKNGSNDTKGEMEENDDGLKQAKETEKTPVRRTQRTKK